MNFPPFASQKKKKSIDTKMVACEEMGYGSYISQDTDLAENNFYLIYITSDNVRHYRMK